MAKRYIRLNWQNRPSVATPVNAANLNKMDKAIDDIDNAVEDLYSVKLNTANIANNDVTTAAGFAWDARRGKAIRDDLTTLNNNLVTGFEKYEPAGTINTNESGLDSLLNQGNYSVYITDTGTHFNAGTLWLTEVKRIYYQSSGVGYVQRLTNVYPSTAVTKTRTYYSVSGGWGNWV